MRDLKDGIRSLVRIDFYGKVHKQFRGTEAAGRCENEARVLEVLAERGCPYVPELLEYDRETNTIVTTNCGATPKNITRQKSDSLYKKLEEEYGVRHGDPEPRNITYSPHKGCFCIIDFELAEVLPWSPPADSPETSGGSAAAETKE